MRGIKDLSIGARSGSDFAIASFSVPSFAELSLCMHVFKGEVPGTHLTRGRPPLPRAGQEKNPGEPTLTSIFLRARLVDEDGELLERECLLPTMLSGNTARHVLTALLFSEIFKLHVVEPLIEEMQAYRNQKKSKLAPLPRDQERNGND